MNWNKNVPFCKWDQINFSVWNFFLYRKSRYRPSRKISPQYSSLIYRRGFFRKIYIRLPTHFPNFARSFVLFSSLTRAHHGHVLATKLNVRPVFIYESIKITPFNQKKWRFCVLRTLSIRWKWGENVYSSEVFRTYPDMFKTPFLVLCTSF